MNSYPNILDGGNFQWTSNSEVPKLKGITGPQQEMAHKYFNIVMFLKHVYVKQAVVYWHSLQTLQNQELIPSHVTPLHRRLTYMTKGFSNLWNGPVWSKVTIQQLHVDAPNRPRIALPGRVTGHQLENKDAQGPPVHSLISGRQMGGVFKASRSGKSTWINVPNYHCQVKVYRR